MITLVALSRLTAMEAKHQNQKKGTTMNVLTHFKIRPLLSFIAVALVVGRAYAIDTSPDPVVTWSTEARKAIIPSTAGDAKPPRVPGGARVPQLSCGDGVARVLWDRQGRVLPRRQGDGCHSQARLRPFPRRGQGR